MRYVYVAGPYSVGDVESNIDRAIAAADTLLNAGYIPFCPHLTSRWHVRHPHEYELWLAYDFRWLEQCEAVVRLPGESPGADREVMHAGHLGIPVYYGVADFLEAHGERHA